MKTVAGLVSIVFVTLILLGTAGADPAVPKPTDGGPVLTKEQLAAAIRKAYRKDENSQFENVFNFLSSRNATQAMVDKYFGIKNPPPSNTSSDPCAISSHLFVRRDRLDTFQLRDQAVDISSAKGASISGTDDERASTRMLTVNGRVEYLITGYDAACGASLAGPTRPHGAPAFGYAFAPFVDAQGTIDFPKKKTDSNNLQAGFDAQATILGGPFFDDQYLILTPYVQTDFNGVAQIQGISAGWEPVNTTVHLGGYLTDPTNPYLAWFWQLRGEFDEKHVSAVGSTGLTKGNYDWLGGTVQVHFDFFPGYGSIDPFSVSPFPTLENRFYTNLTLKSFWNANNDRSATWFEAELGYNITDDKKSSISVKYDYGTDKDTLVTSKKYLLAINYKN
jgi:hypothetical protein